MAEDKEPKKKAIFAGGCFWCTQADFRKVPGVTKVVSGYTGGRKEDPTYEDVSTGRTGHREAVEVFYDPDKVSYDQLVKFYFQHIDAGDPGGQFHDRGSQYETAVFVEDEEQKAAAERAREEVERSGKFPKIATEIRPAAPFYEAEEYHQDYDRKQPEHYRAYRNASGRDRFHDRVWGREPEAAAKGEKSAASEAKPEGGSGRSEGGRRSDEAPDEETLRKKLTRLQFEVTRRHGTEPPFRNEYWDNKREGIYVDVATGEPLFSSKDKFDSGTGWPSFTRPLEPDNVTTADDRSHGMTRVEVKSRRGGSHLGHLFDDGPAPTGQRYCMNSAALRFIPKEDLEREGYGEYKRLFD